MSDRAEEFLDHWESEHVRAVAHAEKAKEAERLASQCADDGARAGISEADLESAAGGDLVSNMQKALDDAAFREMERLGRNDEAAN